MALNVGSATLKVAVYSLRRDQAGRQMPLEHVDRTSIDLPGSATSDSTLTARGQLDEVLRQLGVSHRVPEAVVHRVVHGADHSSPIALEQEVLEELDRLSPLAPLHQPNALAMIRASMALWADARQYAAFDTSWHESMPETCRALPIPFSFYLAGVKRYGFHGLAFQSAMRRIGRIDPELARGRIVLAHLGGGSSLCAVSDGRSVNTTMGMTPLGGIPMATRSGSLDPGVILHLQRHFELSDEQMDHLLWHESGLKGLSGETGDMRRLLASCSIGAGRAVDAYVAGVAQGIAAMATCLKGIDALAFSGGIGAQAATIRSRVVGELEWLGLRLDPSSNQAGEVEVGSKNTSARILVLPIDEERVMAEMIAERLT